MPYYRSTSPGGNYFRPNFFGGFSFFPPVIKWLLISNAIIWFVTDVLFGRTLVGALVTRYFALWPFGPDFLPWQLISYLFLHGDFLHLFFNMLALWMFGMELENIWGSKRFLWYYFACGIGAGIANVFVSAYLGSRFPTVGASGSVFGVLTAFGMMFPDRPIYIYFLLPVKAKFFVAGYVLLELIYLISGTAKGVAHVAHLGGAAVGFVYMLLLTRGFSFADLWSKFKGEPSFTYDQRRARKPVREEVYDAKFFDIKSGRPIEGEEELNQEVVDAILDKINTSGYQSLTEDEKRILNEASKKIN